MTDRAGDPAPAPERGSGDRPLVPFGLRIRRAGRLAWALLGIGGVVVVVGYVLSSLWLLVVPIVLALFPATLLVPLAGEMKGWRIPDWAAALVTLVVGVLAVLLLLGAMVPFVAAELPEVASSAGRGIAELEAIIENISPGTRIDGFSDILGFVQERTGEAGDVAGQALGAATQAFETLAGLALLIVLLFFYLKDGRRLVQGFIRHWPASVRPRLEGAADRAWGTLGAYFRGQLLVAFVDAVLIGLGLLLLGVPLVLPLAVLIFFGGLFPIVGAVVTGAVAVLVALADGGLTIALVAAGIVLLVQQLEGNVLEPLILSRVVDLHPLVVILVITTGGLLLGILGAFLAVPLTATAKRTVLYLLDEEAAGP